MNNDNNPFSELSPADIRFALENIKLAPDVERRFNEILRETEKKEPSFSQGNDQAPTKSPLSLVKSTAVGKAMADKVRNNKEAASSNIFMLMLIVTLYMIAFSFLAYLIYR